MPIEIDPELEKLGLQLLKDVARVGMKAALTGLDSVLSDVGGVLREGERRVKRTRNRVRDRIRETEPTNSYTKDEEEE